MRITVICIIMFCLLALLSQVAGQEESAKVVPPAGAGEEETFNFWMDVKLDESQQLFAALAQADYAMIEQSSQRLKSVSMIERFVRRRTPGYTTQLKNFEFSVDEILRQAEQENIEGVTLGFQQLTLSCVNCHKQLRQ